MSGYTSAADVCTQVLASVAATYQAASVPLPARQYVSVGASIVDPCEQLTVYIDRVYRGGVGVPTGGPVVCGGPLVASVNVELWRCAPPVTTSQDTFTPPTVAAENASSHLAHSDLILLVVAADAAVMTLGLNGEANTGTVTPLARLGGFQGVRATALIPVYLPG